VGLPRRATIPRAPATGHPETQTLTTDPETRLVNLALLSAAHVHTKGFLQNIADHNDRNLIVIYNDVVDRDQRFATESGAQYCGDLSTMLARDDVDGYVICSENTRRLALLQSVIPMGKPVFCEKRSPPPPPSN
jgi:predicted dehydrogenase